MLDVKNLVVKDSAGTVKVDDVSFSVRAGEIVGIAGVAGNGQSELLEAITGIRPSGLGRDPAQRQALALRCGGSRGRRSSPMCRRTGIGSASSPLSMPARTSYSAITAMSYTRTAFSRIAAPFLPTRRRKMEDFDVRPQDPHLRLGLFSGGNQQKIVLAREIEQDPDLLIVGQPTRGVDIGAIEFIHKRLDRHARPRQGGAPGLRRAR